MSFYANVTGYLQYRTDEHLQAAIRRLQLGGWLDEHRRWIPENGCQRVVTESPTTIDDGYRLLVIPPDLYRNLARVTTDLFPGVVRGKVVISSIDGCFDAWIERPLPRAATAPPGTSSPVSDIECIGLEEYAQGRGLGVKAFDHKKYAEWQGEVLHRFHTEHDPDVFGILEAALR